MSSHPVIFFDGICYLCEWYVRLVLKKDKKNIFRFSQIQSDYARITLKKFGILEIAPKTIILVKDSSVFIRSNAILEILKILGGVWRVLYILKIIPGFMRDCIYDFIARNRYRWFGKRDECMIPDRETRSRFL